MGGHEEISKLLRHFYADGASALVDLTLHLNRVRAQLLKLCRGMPKFSANLLLDLF